jgi:DNA-directed RNA polymerase specialized sigma subunit
MEFSFHYGEDSAHAGVLGLFDAANKYNADKQVVFSSYAKHRIKGAILDSLRRCATERAAARIHSFINGPSVQREP